MLVYLDGVGPWAPVGGLVGKPGDLGGPRTLSESAFMSRTDNTTANGTAP